MNKLNAIVLGSLLSLSALSVAHAAETTASATWQASATKDSDSDLVVTPTRALNFVYSANTKAFNTDTGLFDVAIRGDHSSATSFKLEAIVDDSDNTLFSVGGEATKLKVGARFGGTDLGSIGGTVGTKSTAWTTLVDSSNNTGVSSGLWNLTTSAGATANTEVTGQDKFVFYVDSAQDSTGVAKEFKDLTNSLWEGTVSVAFRATWG
ncbi:common pilus major fimbrillin subunit EcpA [Enterobacter cloacae]|uniref:common pilus major fimbrillin subunit EcpA n=1 Tax=Enterobacter cloacae TaxID=550 RepID=UPI0029870B35|nr:fimbrial protein [Enterobacter cloacae]HBM8915143.1 fimbrial protein [Enterobacter cloacae]HCC5790731.1 fimbrial protein [Enterobacter cloacae]HCC6808228.1 fimbrial protein [Enterobacter cloacae]HCC7948798.1 fimbrial protein [Enterobacter cloacae]